MDFLQQFCQQTLNGLSLGSIYALLALGYTMVYGIVKLINFAHGDILMVGAFVVILCSNNGDYPGNLDVVLFTRNVVLPDHGGADREDLL